MPSTHPAKSNAFSSEALFEARREAILRQAAEAFNRRGFANTSMDEVARDLAITKPTLYRYFPSKHAILLACHALAMSYAERAIALASEGGNGLERILAFARENLRGLLGELGSFPVILDVDSLLPDDRAAVTAQRRRISDWFKRTLAEGMEDGSIPRGDPHLLSLFCFGVFNWVPVWYRADGPTAPETILETYLSLFRRTLSKAG